MGSSLRPVLANIIMTELERVIVEPLLKSGKSKFYVRYVSDTLLFFYFQKKRALFLSLISSYVSSLIHFIKIWNLRQIVLIKTIYIFQKLPSIKTKLIYTTKPFIRVNILKLIVTFHGIIKFHGLNPFTTKQRKFVHQAKSLGSKLRRSK